MVTKNNCTTTPIITAIPDVVANDSCTVDAFEYKNGKNGSEVLLYRVNNGGHTWPGAISVPRLGNTNRDIGASALIGNFFRKFCALTPTNEATDDTKLTLFPNPTQDILTLTLPQNNINIAIFDIMGKQLFQKNNCSQQLDIHCSDFPTGLYYLQATDGQKKYRQKLVVER